MNSVQNIINQIENTFSKDDLKSAPRKVLEDLILSVYDGLNKINGTYPDWWDREKLNISPQRPISVAGNKIIAIFARKPHVFILRD